MECAGGGLKTITSTAYVHISISQREVVLFGFTWQFYDARVGIRPGLRGMAHSSIVGQVSVVQTATRIPRRGASSRSH